MSWQIEKMILHMSLWFDSLDEDTRLYILRRLIDIYNDNDHSDIVERIARKIRSIF